MTFLALWKRYYVPKAQVFVHLMNDDIATHDDTIHYDATIFSSKPGALRVESLEQTLRILTFNTGKL